MQIAIGDLVSFELFENNKVIVGTITDIEDDLGRLHVKVTTVAIYTTGWPLVCNSS